MFVSCPLFTARCGSFCEPPTGRSTDAKSRRDSHWRSLPVTGREKRRSTRQSACTWWQRRVRFWSQPSINSVPGWVALHVSAPCPVIATR